MLQSIVFRIVIIVFSFWIVSHNENVLPDWLYYLIVVVYFGIYCYLKLKKQDLLRLLWDFAFINAIIWGKELHDPMTFLLVIIPLINAINYTGGKPHLRILCFLTFGTLLFHLQPLETWIVLPIVSLAIMYWISTIRYKKWNAEKEITERVNQYFLNSEMLKPHQIYGSIIAELNNYFKCEKGQGINLITTYMLKADKLWLVNASEFLWDRTLVLEEEKVETLKNKKTLRLESDNEYIHMFYIPISDIEYVFTCNISKERSRNIHLHGFQDMMKSTFKKMSILLSTEYRISKRREEKFNEIKDSVLYVNQAVKVMHYIRNKMNPLTNLVAYHKEMDTISMDIRPKMEQRIKQEAKQADKDLTEVIKTADYLLDKSKNPFLGIQFQDISIIKIYLVVSEISERLLNQIVEAAPTFRNESESNICIHSNLIECKIMFTDWINNMKKYSVGNERVTMYIEDSKLVIHFENKYEGSEDEIDKLLRDMNSNSKDAVLEGKDYGYGIYIIKSIAKELAVDIKAYKITDQDNKLLCLDFKFSTYEKS